MTPPSNSSQTHSQSEFAALRRAKRIETAPSRVQPLLARVLSGNASPRACIKAFCYECIGFETKEITTCTAWACPLWHVRPFQKKKKKSPSVLTPLH